MKERNTITLPNSAGYHKGMIVYLTRFEGKEAEAHLVKITEVVDSQTLVYRPLRFYERWLFKLKWSYPREFWIKAAIEAAIATMVIITISAYLVWLGLSKYTFIPIALGILLGWSAPKMADGIYNILYGGNDESAK